MRIVSALTVLLALAAPALAQDVIVNGTGSGATLIDPATGQARYVPPLLQPWQDNVIRLRPPGHHRPKRIAKVAPAAAPADTAYTDVAPPPAPKKPRRVAAAVQPVAAPTPAPPPPPKASAPVRGFADIDLITGTGQQQAAAKPAAAPKKAAPVERTASIEKPKAKVSSGTRKDSITFAPNATDPSTAAVAAVRSLASSLASAMSDGSSRVHLLAYAGQRGEKSSDTRRMSLKRALVIRQLLIDDGVPSERIDVFALGGADDDGALDRVDVFLKS